MKPVVPALVALALVVAACTAGDDGPPEVLPTLTPAGEDDGDGSVESSGSEPALTAEVDGGPARSITELEARWEANRAKLVDQLRAGNHGRDGSLLRGPGDLLVDLNRCPDDWVDVLPAVDPLTLAHVGDADAYGRLTDGMRAYFEHVNNNGSVSGQLINFVVIDDQRTPTKAIEAVEDLLLSSDPVAISTSGTTSSQAVFDELNRQCVPQPFVGSAHPAWGDPTGHPWTTGFQMSYSTEAILWGGWIKRNLVDDLPVNVGALVLESDYGRAYLAGFEQWAADNPDVVAELSVATHADDSVQADLETGLTELAASAPDVMLVLTAGDACRVALEQIAGSTASAGIKATFVTNACTDPGEILVPAGRAADGVVSVASPAKSVNDPALGDDPYVAFINDLLADAGVEDETGQAGIGAGQYAWAHVEALRIASELDGGITRSNVLLALRSMTVQHPMLLSGISFSVNGVDDAFFIEGGRMQRFSVGQRAWEPETLVVDQNGATPPCAWNGESCS